MTRLTTCPDAETVAVRAAAHIERQLQRLREEHGHAHLALAGGTTPARTYELLAGEMPEWDGVEVWFADERCVPPDDAESNYRLASETLLEPAGMPRERVHRSSCSDTDCLVVRPILVADRVSSRRVALGVIVCGFL